MSDAGKLAQSVQSKVQKDKQGVGHTAYTTEKFYSLNTGGLKTDLEKLKLVANDLMFRYPTLQTDDFRKDYGYDFAIYRAGKKGMPLYVLPFAINPTNISITVPSASSLAVTMRGIVEDHNGAPLHQIRISGTTGVANLNPNSFNKEASSGGALQSLTEYAFKNTIKAASDVQRQAQRVQSAFSGQTQKFAGKLNFDVKGKTNSNYPVYTGMSFVHNLIRFLDLYMSIKKHKSGKDVRLMFRMYKDGGYYTCALNNYSFVKGAGTYEYNYTIDLTAWRKHDGPLPKPKIPNRATSRSQNKLNKLANAINGIRQTRRLIASVHNVLRGIRGDINDSFIQPMAEISLLMKDTVGLAQTIYDFCSWDGILKEVKESWKQQVIENFNDTNTELQKLLKLRGFEAASISGQPVSPLRDSLRNKIESGKPDLATSQGDSADIVDDLFKNLADYPEIFDDVTVGSLNISPEAQSLINDQMERIALIDVDGVRERRDKISNFAASISAAFGGSSATYNRINGLSQANDTIKKLTTADIEILAALNDTIAHLDTLIVDLDGNAGKVGEDYYSYYVDYAVANGLALSINNVSKFYVPFPTGASIESLALQYLGDMDRWPEIAALNALRAPYVDEEGFFIPVTASAGGGTLSIANADNLFIGQVVEVMSDTKLTVKRKIRAIDVVSAAEVLLTFENASDGVSLSSYRPNENARIHAFMPHTINSNMLVAIPSSAPASSDMSIKITPGLDEMSNLARLAKIDFLLDDQGDLIFSSSGDIKLATGLTNLVQAAKIKLLTKIGHILQHPDLGSETNAGTSTAEIDVPTIMEQLRAQFDEDPRFSGILAAEFKKAGPSLSMSILLGIANNNTALPISVEMPR